MSHTGNWHRNPRKMALELERTKAGAAESRTEPLREVVFEATHPNLLTLHPCASQAQRFHVVAICTCGARRQVSYEPLLATHLAHAPWPRVMRSLTCMTCGGQPPELEFSLPVGQVSRRVPAGTLKVRLA